jgi:ABC-type multidrug transport system ATPase subunit
LDRVGIERNANWLLRDISMEVPGGSFIGLLGPSGSGKSLLLGCLSGTIRPSDGAILFDGSQKLDENLDYYQSRIGVVTQDDLVYASLTAEENLKYAARLRLPGASPESIATAVQGSLRKVGLEEQATRRVDKLSGGQRKRVSIAIELLNRPGLLLLDEPTSGLDPGTQARLMDVLRSLARQGITVVCAAHTTETVHYFDNVIVLGKQADKQTCVFQGVPDDLLAHFNVRNMADLFDLLQAGQLNKGQKDNEAGTARRDTETHLHQSGTGGASTGMFHPPRIVPQIRHPGAQEMLNQTRVSFSRTLKGLLRDPAAVPTGFAGTFKRLTSDPAGTIKELAKTRRTACLAILQPVVLALLVVLTQCNQNVSTYIYFFLVISAIWLGMTLTVRDLVGERKLYVRDRLAGMSPGAYIAGKLAFVITVVGLQALLLMISARIFVWWLLPGEMEATKAELQHGMGFLAFLILLLVGFGGAVIGMIVSTISKSERAAIAFLPLILLPQALVSRVGYGDAGTFWADERTPFSPVSILPKATESGELHWQQYVLVISSLPMISRPATVTMAIRPGVNSLNRWDVAAEWIYLLALLLIHVLALAIIFGLVERRWSLDSR